MIRLSVIIPVYNTLQYLDECVNSVLNQTLQDIEIILIDDESPDGAGKRCDEFAAISSNIKVIHKKNGGLGHARNSGLEVATGKYVTFLDSDDYIKPNYYEQMVEVCEYNNTDVCVSKGLYQCQNDEMSEFVYLHEYGLKTGSEISDLIPRLISRKPSTDDGIWGSACFSVYKRSLLQNNHIHFISERDFMSEDVWFSMDVYNVAKRVFLANIVGYCYRYNSDSLSRSYRTSRFKQLMSTTTQLEEKCRKMGLRDYKDRVALYFWVNFEKCINQEVRFVRGREGIENIKKMAEQEICRKMMIEIYSCQGFSGIHKLLCLLILRGKYGFVYLTLRIYNYLKHKR